jgi:hypothetical protein
LVGTASEALFRDGGVMVNQVADAYAVFSSGIDGPLQGASDVGPDGNPFRFVRHKPLRNVSDKICTGEKETQAVSSDIILQIVA